ncbi:hypothetical protein [Actinomyces glycerinitolerans]|uniref:hypothetical protein n=1 Tax=Actinomyces glycerinitolerans TaxID=1892869 RepID=UPI001114CFA9|nr:hypothetical protein [Actinomyces glycerinitolerans]
MGDQYGHGPRDALAGGGVRRGIGDGAYSRPGQVGCLGQLGGTQAIGEPAQDEAVALVAQRAELLLQLLLLGGEGVQVVEYFIARG